MGADPVATRTAHPPAGKPMLLFDGDCGFCRHWIARWRVWIGDRADFAPYQEMRERFPDVPVAQCKKSVQFITPDGRVRVGAEAVLRLLALAPGRALPLWLYRYIPGVAPFMEWSYALVARHRGFFSTLTRWLWGRHAEPSTFFITRWLFLRGMALVYLIAFLSLWTQIGPLVGGQGLSPIADLLEAARRQMGVERFWILPTLSWLDSSDAMLHLQCAFGMAAALLLLVGIAPMAALAASWFLYLSLSTSGQEFLAFQWDNLLLEAGLIAIFLAPWGLRPKRATEKPPAAVPVFLLRWLLFRLIFLSGAVKLLGGDPVWRDLTALAHHYETQPLPPWTAWFAHQMPLAFHKASCLLMFAVELAVPFLLFAPRRPRALAFLLIASLQFLILFTGNYAFFNLLTLVLCLVALDDQALQRLIPKRLRVMPDPTAASRSLSTLRRAACLALFFIAFPLTVMSAMLSVGAGGALPRPALSIWQLVQPLRSFNHYGLFAVMTTTRPEIIVEGSADGVSWLAYEFRWKPGNTSRRPRFVAPHQPRLDWQLWFEALKAEGGGGPSLWFQRLLLRLLEGSEPTLCLMGFNPFEERTPVKIRATLHVYRFTTPMERRSGGAWWNREFLQLYMPPVSLNAD